MSRVTRLKLWIKAAEREIHLTVSFSIKHHIREFHVVVMQKCQRKCIKNFAARAKLLFCLLNIMLFWSYHSNYLQQMFTVFLFENSERALRVYWKQRYFQKMTLKYCILQANLVIQELNCSITLYRTTTLNVKLSFKKRPSNTKITICGQNDC